MGLNRCPSCSAGRVGRNQRGVGSSGAAAAHTGSEAGLHIQAISPHPSRLLPTGGRAPVMVHLHAGCSCGCPALQVIGERCKNFVEFSLGDRHFSDLTGPEFCHVSRGSPTLDQVAELRGQSFELFGPVNKLLCASYDKAQVAFLACLKEFSEQLGERLAALGRPFEFPYLIEGDKVRTWDGQVHCSQTPIATHSHPIHASPHPSGCRSTTTPFVICSARTRPGQKHSSTCSQTSNSACEM